METGSTYSNSVGPFIKAAGSHKERKVAHCPICGLTHHKMDQDTPYLRAGKCPHCETSMKSTTINNINKVKSLVTVNDCLKFSCGNCKTIGKLDDNFCTGCGSKFDDLDLLDISENYLNDYYSDYGEDEEEKVSISTKIKRFTDTQKEKYKKVLAEFKAGTLKSGKSDKVVTSRSQAMAIAFSVASKV